MNLNAFFSKRRSDKYGCHHFARDVWLEISGEDISEKLASFLKLGGSPFAARRFVKLNKPEEPCFVLFTEFGRDPHVGVYVDGLVFHLAKRFPIRQSISSLSFSYSDVRFFK